MSYSKVITLGDKFADKKEIKDQENSHRFYEEFRRQFRALLNEMEGDYMTLRIKSFNRASLQELGRLYHNLLEMFKRLEPSEPSLTASRLVHYVTSHPIQAIINKLESEIHPFLKSNEVEFEPGTSFRQVSVDSLKKLQHLASSAHRHLETYTKVPESKLLSEKEIYNPSAGFTDKTRA